MDRSTLTPHKRFESSAKTAAYDAISAHKAQALSDICLVKDVQTLRNHIRTIESQNRHLMEELEQTRLDKSLLQAKLVKELGFQEETLLRFQNQKNFQMDQFQIKAQEEIHRVRREAQKQIEAYIRQIKTLEYQVRQQTDKNAYLANQNNKLNSELNDIEKQLIKSREANNDLNDRYQQLTLKEKNGQVNQIQLENIKNQMEQEIEVLLQVEAQKSDTIQSLTGQLARSEASEKNLIDQLSSLSTAFEQLEGHIKIFTQKISVKDKEIIDLKNLVDHLGSELKARQRDILDLADKNKELARVDGIHQNQIRQLIVQNERLYNEVNIQRHRVHDLAITHGLTL